MKWGEALTQLEAWAEDPERSGDDRLVAQFLTQKLARLETAIVTSAVSHEQLAAELRNKLPTDNPELVAFGEAVIEGLEVLSRTMHQASATLRQR